MEGSIRIPKLYSDFNVTPIPKKSKDNSQDGFLTWVEGVSTSEKAKKKEEDKRR